MRNLLLLAPLLASFLALGTRPSPACGFYAPRVFMVSDHFGAGTFALTDHRDVPDTGWSMLAPRSYDSTEIAEAPAGPAITLTLLGTDGAKTVTTDKRVFVRNGWDRHDPMAGYKIETGGKHFEIAVSGAHVNMTFARLATSFWTSDDARWLADNKLPWTGASVERLGDVETYTASVDGEEMTAVRRGDQNLGVQAGFPIGRLEADGMQYLLIEHAGDVHAIWL